MTRYVAHPISRSMPHALPCYALARIAAGLLLLFLYPLSLAVSAQGSGSPAPPNASSVQPTTSANAQGALRQKHLETRFPSAQDPAALREIQESIRAHGRAEVWVRLNAPFRAHGTLVRDEGALGPARQATNLNALATDILRSIPRRHIFSQREFDGFIPWILVEVDDNGLRALRAHPSVSTVQPTVTFKPFTHESGGIVGADGNSSNPGAHEFGFTGSGQTIAILDSGINSTHQAFAQPGKIRDEACFSSNSFWAGRSSLCPSGDNQQFGQGSAAEGLATPCDNNGFVGCGHGTHVAGIAAGDPVHAQTADGSWGVIQGIAKDAVVLPVNVNHQNDACKDDLGNPAPSPCIRIFEGDIVGGLNHVFQNREGTHPVRVVNLSFGSGEYYDHCTGSAYEDAILQLVSAGVSVVAATGNDHSTNSVEFPSCLGSTIAVGATRKDDVIWFSRLFGITDVVAPGVEIFAADAFSNSGGTVKDGTSMAAPHVSGAIAILREQRPDLENIVSIIDALRTTDAWVEDWGSPGNRYPRLSLLHMLGRGISIDPTNVDVSGNGTTEGAILVTALPNQKWRALADTDDSWIILHDDMGTGPGPLTYSVAPNPHTSPRVGRVRVFDKEITITQAANSIHRLDVNSSGAASVAITSSTGHGKTTDYTIPGILAGTEVVLTAPSTAGGATFAAWQGCDSTASRTCTLTMNADRAVTAVYGATTYTLAVQSLGVSGVQITSPTGAAYGGTTNYSTDPVPQNTQIVLTAPASAGGSSFTGWSQCDSVSNRDCTVTMTNNRTVRANYGAVSRTLNVRSSGVSGVPIHSTTSSTYSGSTDYERTGISNNTAINLSAPLSSGGLDFVNWTGCDPSSSHRRYCTVTLDQDRTVTANYSTLEVNYCADWHKDDWGNETDLVFGYMEMGPYCANSYDWHVADVNNDGYDDWYMLVGDTYTIWGGAGTRFSEGEIYRVTIDGVDTNCFDGPCGSREHERVVYQKHYTAPSSSIRFPEIRWFGRFREYDRITWWNSGTLSRCWNNGQDCRPYQVLECGVDSDCAVGNYCDKSNLADPTTFSCKAKPTFNLSVNSHGASAVAINSSSGHGGTTNYTRSGIVSGTSVVLEAPSQAGNAVFSHWNGCTAPSIGQACTVSMTQNRTVGANYVPGFSLTVNSSGASGVTITSPTSSHFGGITEYMRSSIASGTEVTLRAPPTVGEANFSHWAGCNTTSARDCTVSVDGDRTVTVHYATPAYTLNVSSTGANNVLISSPTSSLYEGNTDYSRTGILNGTSIILTAPATTGNASFESWSGCDSIVNRECSLSMTENRTVTVAYQPLTHMVSTDAGPGGSISPTSRTVDHGDTTTFAVSVESGYRIGSVTGCDGSFSPGGGIYTTGSITGTCTVAASFDLIEVNAPMVTTLDASGIDREGATLNASINPNGAATNFWFEYGTTTGYGSSTELQSAGSGGLAVDGNAQVSGLQCGTTYHFRARASNSVGYASPGENRTFNTEACTVDPSISVGHFRVTHGTYSHEDNNHLACQAEFGPHYRLADWNDLVAYHGAGNSMPELFLRIGLPPRGYVGARSLAVSRDGVEMYSSNRQYAINRHDHNLPSGYLSHADIDNHLLNLGSWHGDRHALCWRTTEPNEPVAISPSGTVLSSELRWIWRRVAGVDSYHLVVSFPDGRPIEDFSHLCSAPEDVCVRFYSEFFRPPDRYTWRVYTRDQWLLRQWSNEPIDEALSQRTTTPLGDPLAFDMVPPELSCASGQETILDAGPLPGSTKTVGGCRTIKASGSAHVPEWSMLRLVADERIIFEPGFRVAAGAQLIAQIDPTHALFQSNSKQEHTLEGSALTARATALKPRSEIVPGETLGSHSNFPMDGMRIPGTPLFGEELNELEEAMDQHSALPAPLGFTATSGDGSVALRWETVPEVDGYHVYWSRSAGIHPFTAASYDGFVGNVRDARMIVGELENDTEYFFVVTATRDGRESAASIEVAAIPEAGPVLVAGRYRLEALDAPTVVDLETGLEWQRCALGQQWDGAGCAGSAGAFSLAGAQQVTTALNHSRSEDEPEWRVPAIEELQGLVYCTSGMPAHFPDGLETGCWGSHGIPTLEPTVFPTGSAAGGWFWSRSTHTDGQVWGLDFDRGTSHPYHASAFSGVRVVRPASQEIHE